MHYSSFRFSLLFRCLSLMLCLNFPFQTTHLSTFISHHWRPHMVMVFCVHFKSDLNAKRQTHFRYAPFIVLLTPEKTPHANTHTHFIKSDENFCIVYLSVCLFLHSRGILRFCVCMCTHVCFCTKNIVYIFCMTLLAKEKNIVKLCRTHFKAVLIFLFQVSHWLYSSFQLTEQCAFPNFASYEVNNFWSFSLV